MQNVTSQQNAVKCTSILHDISQYWPNLTVREPHLDTTESRQQCTLQRESAVVKVVFKRWYMASVEPQTATIGL